MTTALKRFDYVLHAKNGTGVHCSTLWAPDLETAKIQAGRIARSKGRHSDSWKVVDVSHVWKHLTRDA